MTSAEVFLVAMKGGGRILLGDNTGGRPVMLRPIRFQCVGVRTSTGPTFATYIHTQMTIRNSDWRRPPEKWVWRKLGVFP